MAAATEVAGHLAAQQRQHFVELVGGFHAWINQNLHLRFPRPRLLKKSKGKAGLNPEGVLAVRSAPRKIQFHLLPRRTQPGDVRKKYRARQDFVAEIFLGFAYDS